MPRYHYERLSDRAAGFLANETPRTFAHASSIHVFETGPLATPDGGVDFEAIRSGVAACLSQVPRLTQELLWIPIENHPVWIDDADFNLGYHLRHTSLPRPGGFAQLEAIAARIMAQRLDRSRPLWECWVMEGLEGDRFALLLKTHHCMVDETGTDLLGVLLSANPEARDAGAPLGAPRPYPSARELVVDEVLRQAKLPRRIAQRLHDLVSNPQQVQRHLASQARSAAEMLGYTLRPPMETPLNGRIGHHRRFKGVAFSLDDARSIRRALGGMMLDVILTTIAGAVRRYLTERLVSPASLDFRVATPVGLATGRSGERAAEWIIDLPLWEKDVVKRHQQIGEITGKHSEIAGTVPASVLLEADTWFGGRLLSLGARALASHSPVNMTLINAPGTQAPLYFRGARMLETYGQTPLRETHGLGIAVMSYDGRLFFGLNADFDLVPDLDLFARDLQSSFEELRQVAESTRTAESA